MAALRVLLLFLLLNLVHAAGAAVPGYHAQNSVEFIGQKYPNVPSRAQIVSLITEKQAAYVTLGFDPDMGYGPGKDVPGTFFLCDCKNKVALLYIHVCRDISLQLSSHKIAFTFHSFP
jgi:hypothetical protein